MELLHQMPRYTDNSNPNNSSVCTWSMCWSRGMVFGSSAILIGDVNPSYKTALLMVFEI
jgi:hypothetical protein